MVRKYAQQFGKKDWVALPLYPDADDLGYECGRWCATNVKDGVQFIDPPAARKGNPERWIVADDAAIVELDEMA